MLRRDRLDGLASGTPVIVAWKVDSSPTAVNFCRGFVVSLTRATGNLQYITSLVLDARQTLRDRPTPEPPLPLLAYTIHVSSSATLTLSK